MKYNPNPKKGSNVRVRLPDGMVVTAEYECQCGIPKDHYVRFGKELLRATGQKPVKHDIFDRVRFVYPIEQMGNYKRNDDGDS